MVDLKSVKLIVWDLDETLWSGTLSEEGASLSQENIKLINDLVDCGIINSICSKNDFNQVKSFLSDLGIWSLFVFPSINWESKGPQLVDKIDRMALRPNNVLFIDDNVSNLGEAKHYLPQIQVATPDIIPDLLEQVALLEKKDLCHKRLQQYKVLEAKDIESHNYSSNEAFLYDSCIIVDIRKDCSAHIERIYELIQRTNQLNYTKKRISQSELESILDNSSYDCGYVTVSDRFGDYGIVGFYAKKGDSLEHFLFSCRTMGQKIEQWVYAELGFPRISVVGEVRTPLNESERPGWVNQKKNSVLSVKSSTTDNCPSLSILLKGPCDLSHSQVYIKNLAHFDTEFTYVSNTEGQIIDAYNHSVHIEGLKTYSAEDKRIIGEDCWFVDPAMLSGCFFEKEYDVIVLSTLIESTYQIYQKKGTSIRVVFGGMDLTDPSNWDGYLTGKYYSGGNHFTIDYLQEFSNKYDCVGMTTPEMYISFLEKCLEWLPEKTHLCLILGVTRLFEGEDDVKIRHRELNEAVKEYSRIHPKVHCIEVDSLLRDSSDFAGGINHFSARVYYAISQEIIHVIQEVTGVKVESFSSRIVWFDKIVLELRGYIKRVLSEESILYRFLKNCYSILYKSRNANN